MSRIAQRWNHGICASSSCTTDISGQDSANFRIYFRFLTEKPSYQEIHAPGPRISGRVRGNSKPENFTKYRNISTINFKPVEFDGFRKTGRA
jgi:hypothetical protein